MKLCENTSKLCENTLIYKSNYHRNIRAQFGSNLKPSHKLITRLRHSPNHNHNHNHNHTRNINFNSILNPNLNSNPTCSKTVFMKFNLNPKLKPNPKLSSTLNVSRSLHLFLISLILITTLAAAKLGFKTKHQKRFLKSYPNLNHHTNRIKSVF